MSHRDNQKTQSLAPHRCRAFTFVEILVVVMILGLLAAVGMPVMGRVIDAARQSTAVVSARSVNAAQVSYALIVPSAQANWNAAAADSDRLQLLINANLLPGAPTDYLTSPGGYSLQLGGLRSNSVLTKGGTTVSY